MTVTGFFKGAYLLPATIFSSLSSWTLGDYVRSKKNIRNNKGEVIDVKYKIIDAPEKVISNTTPGLFGYILDAFKYVGRNISNVIFNHKTAIATAFWTSLVLAGAAALTLFLWPAALTAVATFTIAGLSIAGVVGANALAQIGVAAALTAVAANVAVYTVAGVVNTINWIRSCFPSTPKAQQPEEGKGFRKVPEGKENEGSANSMKKLHTQTDANTTPVVEKNDANVVNFKAPLDSTVKAQPQPQPVVEEQAAAVLKA